MKSKNKSWSSMVCDVNFPTFSHLQVGTEHHCSVISGHLLQEWTLNLDSVYCREHIYVHGFTKKYMYTACKYSFLP